MKLFIPIILLVTSSFAEETTFRLPERSDPSYCLILEVISRKDLKTEKASKAIRNAYTKIGMPIEIDDPRENFGYWQALSLSIQLTPEDLDNYKKMSVAPFVDFVSREAVFMYFFTNSNCQKIDFDKESWCQLKEYSRNRYRMMKSFTENHHPKGKERKFLLEALGNPFFENENSISYFLGSAWHPMDDTFITFSLESGVVHDFKFHSKKPNQRADPSRKTHID